MFRRANAENHLLIIIVAFVATVLGIRGYLFLTGYPQISTGELHVAHMLWGGIALFVGSTTMLLYRGLYLSKVAAILTGFGWGLFIDEVGKFLTKTNDYFFAPAAVIIYVIFLIVVTIYVIYFRPDKNEVTPSDNEAFADVRELLDGVAAGELTYRERQLLNARLERLKHDDEKRYRDLGVSIQAFVDSQPPTIRQQRIESIGEFVAKVVNAVILSRSFLVVLGALIGLDVTIALVTTYGFGPFQGIFHGDLSIKTDDVIRLTCLGLRLLAQIIVVTGLIVIKRGHTEIGRRMIVGALLVMIIVLDSVDFYFGQFSTSYTVALHVFILAMIEGRFGTDRIKAGSIEK